MAPNRDRRQVPTSGRSALLSWLAVAAFLQGCDDGAGEDGPAPFSLDLAFGAVVGPEPFACGRTYMGLGATDSSWEPIDLRFFVSEPTLRSSDGIETPLRIVEVEGWQTQGVALVDLEDGTGRCTAGTPGTRSRVSVESDAAPAGNPPFVLGFTLGVPFSINHQEPAQALPPLDTSNLSWGRWSGYLFTKVEGQTPRGRFEVHVGSTGCEASGNEISSCLRPNRARVELDGFTPATSTITLDLAALLADANLATGTGSSIGCASDALDADCTAVMGHIGIDTTTGLPTAGQDAFSLR
jgi:uncharacterized repeat protein (TIGR04052 family)